MLGDMGPAGIVGVAGGTPKKSVLGTTTPGSDLRGSIGQNMAVDDGKDKHSREKGKKNECQLM